MLNFKFIDKCWQEATGVSSDDADFFLEKNEWDDYGTSGEKYGYYNGYSDDVIDDAFDGCPEATWNVD